MTSKISFDGRTSYDKGRDSKDEFAPVSPKLSPLSFGLLSLSSLGVIYGDIGTSPLYVLNLFSEPPPPDDVVGICSLIIWSLIILVTLKYVTFVLTADYRNEGGTFALCCLINEKHSNVPPALKQATIFISIIGASLLLGDGAITPAISVLSAIEGIAVVKPDLEGHTVVITLVILVMLFLVQPFGTTKVGGSFGPCIIIWFVSIFCIGVWNIAKQPMALYAFNPYEGLKYFGRHGRGGYFILGSVFLSVTGLEALYADLGHFRRGPIRATWLLLVFPSLVTNYLGQTAFLINNPEKYSTPFFQSIPPAIYWYMLVISTIATIIASQAIITGSYSIMSQAIWQDFAPPLTIYQTSKTYRGQIFISSINWMMMIMTAAIVLGFRSSAAITQVYGITVCSTMILTTVLYLVVLYYVWGNPWWKALAFACFLFVDVSFWGSVLYKIADGGYVAIIFATVFTVPMLIWYTGEKRLKRFNKLHDTSSSLSRLPERFKMMKNELEMSTTSSIVGEDPKADTEIKRIFNNQSEKSGSEKKSAKKSHSEKSHSEKSPVEKEPSEKAPSEKSSSEKSSSEKSPSEKPPSEKPPSDQLSSDLIQQTKKEKKKPKRMSFHKRANKSKKDSSISLENSTIFSITMKSNETGQSVRLPVTFLPRVGIFLTNSSSRTPQSFEEMILRTSGIPKTVIFLKVSKVSTAFAPDDKKIVIQTISDDIYLLVLSFGYAERIKSGLITERLSQAQNFGLPKFTLEEATLFATAETIKVVNRNIFWRIVLLIYAFMKKFFFGGQTIELPPKETVYVATVVTL